jgi:hypothetical protein
MNYLLNLGFSLAATGKGNFQPDNSNPDPLLRSSVWLSGGANLPAQDSFYQISSPLNQSDWSFAQEATSPLQVYANQAYNLLVRVFQADSPTSTSYKVMLNAVFGQGGSGSVPASPGVQSPLLVNGLPRTLINSLQLAFANPQQQQPYWSAPASDGAWTFGLGTIHGADNTYSFNAGASVCTNPSTGSPIYQYGFDPVLKVGMGVAARLGKTAA